MEHEIHEVISCWIQCSNVVVHRISEHQNRPVVLMTFRLNAESLRGGKKGWDITEGSDVRILYNVMDVIIMETI